MFIYVIRCSVNGKHYVGYDTGPESDMRRWKLHVSSARNHSPPAHRSKLYPAMLKRGLDSFSVDIVDRASSISELKLLEKSWIRKLNSIMNGYNIRDGGQGFSNLASLPADEAEKQLEAIKRGSIAANKKRWAGKTLDEKREELKKFHESYTTEARSQALKNLWADPIRRAERSASMRGKKKTKRETQNG